MCVYVCERSGSDYGAVPEATQWNGSMDEPPVASLASFKAEQVQ